MRKSSDCTVADVLAAVEEIAPAYLALDRDPTGLLIGDPQARVTRIAVALDVTSTVVEAAKTRGAEMIVAHHPLIYHPLKAVRADEAHPGSVVLAAARAGIAVACAHTCWDVAEGGVNDVVAGLLGIEYPRPLRVTYRESLVKITVYVPTAYRTAVLNAMSEAGAGAIGNYDRCAFWISGTGTFRARQGARPFIGEIGRPEYVPEERLEMIAPESRFGMIVGAMKAAHPYEEVAYEVYPLRNTAREWGIGRVGRLSFPCHAGEFVSRIKTALCYEPIRHAGPLDKEILSVAVCGGAGAELMSAAISRGADALVTSDVRHHEFVEAAARNFLLIDAGHAATETPGARQLGTRLAQELKIPVDFIAD